MVKKKETITAIDGKEYPIDEICNYNFLYLGGRWTAGPMLKEGKFNTLKK